MESNTLGGERATLLQLMPTPCPVLAPALPSTSNQRLLGAALAGLLCLAPAACSTKEEGANGLGAAGAAGTGEPAVAGASAATAGQSGAGEATSDAGQGGGAGSHAAAMGGAGDSASAGAGGRNAASAGAGGFAEAGSGNLAGGGGAPPEPAHITSSTAAGVLTEADFKALCDARSGTVELMPHCGGFATAKGFSYDNGTQLLSEHTCAGANTCGGWNCVIVD
jgi:hypothetical protein